MITSLISIGAIIGMASAWLSGHSFGFRKGMKTSKEPKVIDYSNVIEVGDTIGFMFAGDYYHEGIVEIIVNRRGTGGLCEEEDIQYIVTITRDESPCYFSNWVGKSATIGMKYRQWTMVKKHVKPVCDKDGNIISDKK